MTGISPVSSATGIASALPRIRRRCPLILPSAAPLRASSSATDTGRCVSSDSVMSSPTVRG
ncbi:Uncharacterised protein [Mycobacteroides abscessus subsp. abscessus]|nr:Uncharacterised protein [Mycobacteroides abscessus subsp. abscessus]